MKFTPIQKWLLSQDNLIGSAVNSPKEEATTVNANMINRITGENESAMLHLDPVKNIDTDRFEKNARKYKIGHR